MYCLGNIKWHTSRNDPCYCKSCTLLISNMGEANVWNASDCNLYNYLNCVSSRGECGVGVEGLKQYGLRAGPTWIYVIVAVHLPSFPCWSGKNETVFLSLSISNPHLAYLSSCLTQPQTVSFHPFIFRIALCVNSLAEKVGYLSHSSPKATGEVYIAVTSHCISA